MRMRRLLAALLLLSMLVSMVPTSIFSVETEKGTEGESTTTVVDPSVMPSDNLFLDKKVTLGADGTYTIDLGAYATGTPITKTVAEGVPLDVVLVVDQSGSMKTGVYGGNLNALKAATRNFVNALYANGEAYGVNHRIAICGFASDAEDGYSIDKSDDGTYTTEGYTIAGGMNDFSWVNTGLFVKGEFKNYNKVTYTPVESADKMEEDQFYAGESDLDGDGVTNLVPMLYSGGKWYYYWGGHKVGGAPEKDADGNVIKTAAESLFEKFNGKIYKIGAANNSLTSTDYAAAWEYIANGANGTGGINDMIDKAIDNFSASGSTRTMYGMKMARRLLESVKDDGRKKIVVVFTDGAPGKAGYAQGDGDSALAEAGYIKEELKAEIYDVALATDPESEYATFMTQMSSNYLAPKFVESAEGFDVYKAGKNSTFACQGLMVISTGYDGVTPYFYKDASGQYWPMSIISDGYGDNSNYSIVYITDEGETELVSGKKTEINALVASKVGTVYMLSEPEMNPNAKTDHFLQADSVEKLTEVFETIASKMTTYDTAVTLDTTAILKDVLADGFTLTDNTQITVSVVPGSVKEEHLGVSPNGLTSDKITWGEAQQVLTFPSESTGTVVVNGAFDQTEMTLTATVENGEINVTGFDYAAQFIGKDHVGSKLVVTVTGVEAVKGVTTNSATSTNKATSGVYEGPESDADKDGIPGEIETAFPVPNTYLTSEYYYLDENGSVTFDIRDFRMDESIHVSDGFHFFNTAEPGTSLETEYGTVTVSGNGTVTYQLKEGVELTEDVICLFGKTEDITVKAASANANGNMWSKITILPPLDAVGKLHTDKSATLMGDGTYTIDLEAFATGTPAITALSTGIPLDVVLVVDQSGSLQYVTQEDGTKQFNGAPLAALKASVSSFVHELQANADANGLDHRVSICGFASDEYIGWSGVPEYEKADNYTYAGELKDIYFTNTGLFVNGEFKKYGASTYEPFIVEKVEDVVDNKIYVAREKGTQRYLPVYYYPGHTAWRLWVSSGWSTFFNKDLTDEEKAAIKEAYGSDKAGANAAIGEAEKKLNVSEFLKKYDLYYLNREVTVQLTDEDYQNSWENVSVNGSVNPDIAKTIDSLAGNGATFSSYGMRMARKMLENAPATADGVERKKVVIVFTDGLPGGTGVKNVGEAESTLAEAQKIKDGLFDKNGNAINAEIYTVGIYEGNTGENAYEFMNQLSSNCASHKFADEPVSAVLDTSQEKYLAISRYLTLTPYFYKLEKENGDVEYCPIKVFRSSTGYDWRYVSDEGLMTIPAGMVSSDDPKTITGVYTLESGEYNPDLGYYSNSDNFSDLPGLFREIITEVSTYSSEVQLDAKAILKDVMADGFTLTNNTQITVSVVPGSVKEQFADVGANRLGSEHIAWGTPQKVLTFKYSEAKEGTGNVIVNGAADQTKMTITATASEDGVITVTGFNYAAALDNHKENAQYICAGHPGSKLVVTITGVEAKNGVTTDSFTVTNKGASGIYEASDSDLDGDGTFGEMQAYFPIPTTYLSSKTYYVDYSGELIIDPADFLMTIKGYSLDKNGYHGFGAPDTTIELDHGTVTVLDDGKLKFTMKSDGLGITDTFYLFGHTDNATVKAAMANTTGNMWSKVTIITPEDITGKLFLDKEATLTGDGTYTIDLNAYATGTPVLTSITEGVPLDVVLVIDQSGSLYANGGTFNGEPLDKLKEAVSCFAETLRANGEGYGIEHRISICGFASNSRYGASGIEGLGLTYAGTSRDHSWVNTGLFVDGEFKNYATTEYVRVEDPAMIATNRYYTVKCDPDGNGIYEMARVQYVNKAWQVGNSSYRRKLADTAEELIANYEVYTAGNFQKQLIDKDYANSWVSVSSGENGQGVLNPAITKVIDSLASNGPTCTYYGLKMAADMLRCAPKDDANRKKIVIIFTDGESGYSSATFTRGESDYALAEATKIKKTGAEVYCVGVYSDSTANKVDTFMNQLSSNYVGHTFASEPTKIDLSKGATVTVGTSDFYMYCPDVNCDYYAITPYYYKVDGNYWPIAITHSGVQGSAYRVSYIRDDTEVLIAEAVKDKIVGLVGDVYLLEEHERNQDAAANYYYHSADMNDLAGMFEGVVDDATTFTSEVTLDATAILKDVMADGFTLTDNTQITVSVVPGSVKEEHLGVSPNGLTSDKIDWGNAQQVLTFNYPELKEGTGKVVVNGAADQTEMTITAKVEGDTVIVSGFNYANPADNYRVNAQYIGVDHPGSKLVVQITGVEAKTTIQTDSTIATNKGTSGIYEAPDSDADGDGVTGEMQASFPVPSTHLTSEYYYLDENGSVTINPKDFLMSVGGVNADADGYHYFSTPGTVIETQYGTVTINQDGTITYTIKEGVNPAEETFYLFGTTKDITVTAASANENGNMWSKITILPPKDVSGKLNTDKVATLNKDGTYTIDLSAFATGTPSSTVITEGVPLDVVLVVDQSGSMAKGSAGAHLADLQAAVTNFVDALYENGESFGINHRVSICGFACESVEGITATLANGYSYAGDEMDLAWINTGLFVNGGFKKYGKAEYAPVTSADEINRNRVYPLDWPVMVDGKEVIQQTYVMFNKGWVVPFDTNTKLAVDEIDANGKVIKTAEENLLEKCGDRLYKYVDETVQLTPADYAASWENIAAGTNGTGGINAMITNYIDHFSGAGATRTHYGMKMARHMLENAPKDGVKRKQIVVVFTDGAPGREGYTARVGDPALEEAGLIKNMGVEIYSVALSKSMNAAHEAFVDQISSNYKSAEWETAVFDIREARRTLTAAFMVDSYIPDVGNAKGPLFYYHEGDQRYYQLVAYWLPENGKFGTFNGENNHLVYADGISVYYITDEGETLLCEADSVENINLKMEGQPIYKLKAPEVNEQAKTNYLLRAESAGSLNEMFKTVAKEMTAYTTEVALDATAILKDVMADGFTLTNNTQITVSVVPGSVKEEFADVGANRLGSEHISWGAPQEVLTFKYSEAKEGTGNVIVNGAADQTEMTLTAKIEGNTVLVSGFNYAAPLDNHKQNAQYIGVDHPGSKLVVTITGVEAKADVVTDSNTTTNKGTSGIYEGPDSDLDGDNDKGELQASFPIPTTRIASKVYVMDYAKTMDIDPIDFLMSLGTFSLDMDGEGYEDGYNYFDSNSPVTKLTGDYGNVELKDGKLTYTPTKTNWNGFDTFHVFGKTDDATVKKTTANANGNMWAKISVIPANNVYYEDTFVTNEETGTAGIIYTGAWEIVSETDSDSNKEHAESGESTEKGDDGTDHQGGVHGWEDDLADDTGFSDGSAHVAGSDGKVGATATFTFTGTGVDIYSRTNSTTGMVIAMLYEGTGKNLVAQYSIMVDNLAASGDYYQIPTLSFFKIPARDENGKVIKDENGNNVMVDMPYGTYTVKLIASKANESQTGSARFLYYLDGIRVYNPIQNLEGNETVSGAYGEKELNAHFVEIRDKLLDAESFSAEEGNESAGAVFIDRITSEDGTHDDNAKTVEIGTYQELGPKNEVYLSANQIIAFAVPYREGAHYYVGLKSLTGRAAGAITNSTGDFVNMILVGHTTDMYYEVTPEWTENENGEKIGIIYIHAAPTNGNEDGNGNYDGAILSVTKLKVTGPEAKTFRFARISTAKLLEYIEEDLAPAVEEDTSSPDEEEAKPEEPGEDADKPGSGTNNDEQSALQKLMREILRIIFGNLRSWFKS